MDRSQPRLHIHTFYGFTAMFLVSLFFNIHTCYGDVGFASLYNPPDLPTCYGIKDSSQYQSINLFAAAGDGIWANGTACGRKYLVRCITSTTTPYACNNRNQTIEITIVDHIGQEAASVLSAYNTTLFLSPTAFGSIANLSIASSYINIELEQVYDEDVALNRGSVPPSGSDPITLDASGHS